MFSGQPSQASILDTNFYQSAAATVSLIPVALLLDGSPAVPSSATLLAIFYLATVVTVLGMALWLVLIKSSGAATASSIHLLNPVFGLVLSHLILGKPVIGGDLIGAAFIAAGLLQAMRVTPFTLQRNAREYRTRH